MREILNNALFQSVISMGAHEGNKERHIPSLGFSFFQFRMILYEFHMILFRTILMIDNFLFEPSTMENKKVHINIS